MEGFRADCPNEGEGVGFEDGPADRQPVKAPNCTSRPEELLPASPLFTVKVIVVLNPRPVAVKDDNSP